MCAVLGGARRRGELRKRCVGVRALAVEFHRAHGFKKANTIYVVRASSTRAVVLYQKSLLFA